MVEAVKAAKRFASAHAWNDYALGHYEVLSSANTDLVIEEYARNKSDRIYHLVATSEMSAQNASCGVVNPELRVEGLRVIDGSVLPYIPSAHTQAPIYLFMERGADLIKQY
ncbi:hypothetical protein BDQ12DRAFT_382457 [Crucibulum laeve]|uniref:Glucose-methanol-choline oxidoreductase C-terminal domain-containing protein n=1 Tax=Crucibulum laeve TaxID=68775 RepID=A0A5C3LLN0_9AGAR|nr:hypothetical protein BDQ12DRAFT_382457 [Crucibulum laeve]